MNNYSIILDNNTLRVINKTKGKELTKNEIFVLLHDIDSNSNTKVFSGGENLIIKCTRIGVNAVLKNPEDIMKSKYRYLLSKTMNKLNEGVKQIQVKKHKGKPTLTQKALKITTAVAPVVLIAALTTCKSEIKDVDSELFKEAIPMEDLHQNMLIDRNKEIIAELNNNDKIKETVTIANTNNIEVNNIVTNDNYQVIDTVKKSKDNEKAYNVDLNVSDLSNTSEIGNVDKYTEEIEAAAKKYGWSPNFIKGLMTTESRGKEVNLMQIIHKAFNGQVMNIYNYDKDEWMKVVFTNTPDKFKDVDITISEEELKNPKTNISAAAIILNYYANNLDTDNILLICDAYNKGMGNINTNLKADCENIGKTYEQVLNDPTNTDFLDYSYVCGQGAENYVRNVFQFIPNAEDGVYFYRMKDDKKEKVTLKVNRVLEQEYARAR